MRQIIIFFVVFLIFAAGWWFFYAEDSVEQVPQPVETQTEPTPSRPAPVPEPISEKPVIKEEQVEGSIVVPESMPVVEEEEEKEVAVAPPYLGRAIEWVISTKDVLASVGRSYGLQKGFVTLGEGEQAPDIQGIISNSQTLYRNISFPEESEEMTEKAIILNNEMSNWVGQLSNPPSMEELEAAMSHISEIGSSIDALLLRLQKRQSEYY